MTLDELRLRAPGKNVRLPDNRVVFKTVPSAMQHIVLSGFELIKDWPNVYVYPSRRNEKNRCECYNDNILQDSCDLQLERIYKKREGDVW